MYEKKQEEDTLDKSGGEPTEISEGRVEAIGTPFWGREAKRPDLKLLKLGANSELQQSIKSEDIEEDLQALIEPMASIRQPR